MYHFHTSDQRKQQGNISHIPSSPGHYNDIALSTGHYNDIGREYCSFELFDLLSDIQKKWNYTLYIGTSIRYRLWVLVLKFRQVFSRHF